LNFPKIIGDPGTGSSQTIDPESRLGVYASTLAEFIGIRHNVAAGFIPARTVVVFFVRRSAISAIKNGVIRRSGGDKLRRYTLGDSMRIIAR
jgi:hypothetical protein